MQIMQEYRPGWTVTENALFKLESDRITATLEKECAGQLACCLSLDHQRYVNLPHELVQVWVAMIASFSILEVDATS